MDLDGNERSLHAGVPAKTSCSVPLATRACTSVKSLCLGSQSCAPRSRTLLGQTQSVAHTLTGSLGKSSSPECSPACSATTVMVLSVSGLCIPIPATASLHTDVLQHPHGRGVDSPPLSASAAGLRPHPKSGVRCVRGQLTQAYPWANTPLCPTRKHSAGALKRQHSMPAPCGGGLGGTGMSTRYGTAR